VNTTLCRSSSVLLALLGALLLSRVAWAQQQKPPAPGFPDAPGKETLLAKCFQCHSAGMWMDHRQDRRGWESVLYRMVGRGALWTEEEIKAMADYLGTVYARRPQ
jgi:mono/diheme cytochrome c family protein